jgi:hypothetical protein
MDILQMGNDMIITQYACCQPFMVFLTERETVSFVRYKQKFHINSRQMSALKGLLKGRDNFTLQVQTSTYHPYKYQNDFG